MEIYELLKKDHRKVDQLFEEISSAKSEEKKQELFEQVRDELLAHAETEDETFYEALKEFDETEDKIEHAEEEHEKVKALLSELDEMSVGDNKWDATFEELKKSVKHHVKEEEGEIFEKAKKLLSKEQAVELAEEMQKLKEEFEAEEA